MKRRKQPPIRDWTRLKLPVVYRVQDADGRGPWKPGFSHVWTADRTESESARLPPIQVQFPDFTIREGFTGGVGCEQLSVLRQWFSESEYNTLREYGYRCVRMTVDKIIASSSVQCIFERWEPLANNVIEVRLYPHR